MSRFLITSRATVRAIRHDGDWWYPLTDLVDAIGLGATKATTYVTSKQIQLGNRLVWHLPESTVVALLATPARVSAVRALRQGARFSSEPAIVERAPSEPQPPAPAPAPPTATVSAEQVRDLVDVRIAAILDGYAPRRREIPDGVRAVHTATVGYHHGVCPCCWREKIVVNGRVQGGQFDHFYSSSQPDEAHTWLICAPCHRAITEGRLDRDEIGVLYQAYHYRRRALQGEQLGLEAAQ